MKMPSPEMTRCIDACLDCYRVCLHTASSHCLEEGGAHVEPKHYRIMLACVESCRTAAHIMLLDTPLHRETCGACAKICEACAQSCREVGGMEKCVEACEQCAAICREMAGH
ncbi:four-helix bundle copper-binding protein [Brucella intermedia]|nr:four-helix bundle copper-binding protein [Brucella intermedia]KAB2707924.1 four-helix bundle copper-binding protein [Brucella intermedia]MPR64012.1 four-helix bundle copper-binding protein [Brucella intermedia]